MGLSCHQECQSLTGHMDMYILPIASNQIKFSKHKTEKHGEGFTFIIFFNS